jgi:hypothetical protein
MSVWVLGRRYGFPDVANVTEGNSMAVAQFLGQSFDEGDMKAFGSACGVESVAVDQVGWLAADEAQLMTWVPRTFAVYLGGRAAGWWRAVVVVWPLAHIDAWWVDGQVYGKNDDASCFTDEDNCIEGLLDIEYISAVAEPIPLSVYIMSGNDGFLEWIEKVGDRGTLLWWTIS